MKIKQKQHGWGGKRPNAGAKKKDQTKKTVSYCLNEKTIKTIESYKSNQSKSQNLDDLIDQNKKLKQILGVSNMKGMQHILDLEPGGIYARLGQVSRWLTALVWEEYPDNSYDNLYKRIKAISPELAELVNQYGINFAIVAPHENDPCTSPSWQLIHNCEGFTNSPKYGEIRAYLLELFFDIPSEYSDLIAQVYKNNFEQLEEIGDLFEKEIIAEVMEDLKLLELSLDDLINAANSLQTEQLLK